MESCLLSELERTFALCSDCLLHPDYTKLLKKLENMHLSQELVDFLCAKTASTKHIWELRFAHLRILLRNPSAWAFDLKEFYLEKIHKSRRLALKLFFIRGYAIFAGEEELNPVMEKFQKSLEKNHDYIDYNYILSVAGIPYLFDRYGYDCFATTLKKAKEEYEKIDPLLRGYFTLNEDLEQVNLLSAEEVRKRSQQSLSKYRNKV